MIYHKEPGKSAPRYTVNSLRSAISDALARPDEGYWDAQVRGQTAARLAKLCMTIQRQGWVEPTRGNTVRDPIASSCRHARCRLASGRHLGLRSSRNAEGGRTADRTGARCVVRRSDFRRPGACRSSAGGRGCARALRRSGSCGGVRAGRARADLHAG